MDTPLDILQGVNALENVFHVGDVIPVFFDKDAHGLFFCVLEENRSHTDETIDKEVKNRGPTLFVLEIDTRHALTNVARFLFRQFFPIIDNSHFLFNLSFMSIQSMECVVSFVKVNLNICRIFLALLQSYEIEINA